jgi:hypothetical protein
MEKTYLLVKDGVLKVILRTNEDDGDQVFELGQEPKEISDQYLFVGAPETTIFWTHKQLMEEESE